MMAGMFTPTVADPRLHPRALLLLIALLLGAQLSLAAHVHGPEADAAEIEHCLVCPLQAGNGTLHVAQTGPALVAAFTATAFAAPDLLLPPLRPVPPSIRDPPALH